jgi:hypothetical protein
MKFVYFTLNFIYPFKICRLSNWEMQDFIPTALIATLSLKYRSVIASNAAKFAYTTK